MSRLCKALIMGLLTGILGLAVSITPLGLDLEENVGLDLLFELRGARDVPSDVVIVTMDKVSADRLDLPFEPEKWPRSYHARLTEALVDRGAAVIAFDIIFDEAHANEVDGQFADAIARAGNVVLAEYLQKETVPLTEEGGKPTGALNIESLVLPISPLALAAVATAPFPLPKVPVKVSQYWTFKTSAGDKPTLPVVVFQLFALDVYHELVRLFESVSPSQIEKLPRDKNELIRSKNVENLVRVLRDIFKKNPAIAEIMLEELQNSNIRIADEKKKHMLKSLIKMYQRPDSCYLNYYGPPNTIATFSYYQILQGQKRTSVTQQQLDLEGKAVFVGMSERFRLEQKDGFYTVYSGASGLDISGVEIAATALANLLEDMPVQPLGVYSHLATLLLWGVGLGILCRFLSTIVAAAGVIGLGAIYLIAAQYQFTHAGHWYPLALPLFFQTGLAFFGTVSWRYFDTARERKNIRKAFGYYLPDKVVDQVVTDMVDSRTSSQMVYGTCLCTDAEKYSTLAETLAPTELSNFMNTYYEAVFQPVREHGGIVSDVVGDAMMAIWATARPDTALRNQACLAALDINRAVHVFNESSQALRLPTRIGLHSGQMALGSIGAIDHYEYRPVGEVVNTAARIESLNKHLGTRILVSREVLHQLDGFLTRELGEFLLVGKSKPIGVYELLCRREESTAELRSFCAIFIEALSAYRRQSWEEAIERFHESMRIRKQDGPSLFYLELCKRYRQNPPEEIWDGVVRLTKK